MGSFRQARVDGRDRTVPAYRLALRLGTWVSPGSSAIEAEPAYQVSYGIANANSNRAVPDVAFDADLNTGFSVYDTTRYQGHSGWFKVGGTSAGAPQWAALVALADQGRLTPLSSSDMTISPVYLAATGAVYASNFSDITSGSNGGFSAGAGYDLVTGLGSPKPTTS